MRAKPHRTRPSIREPGGTARRALTLVSTTTALIALLSPAVASASAQRQVLTLKLVATNTYNVDNDPSGGSGGDLSGSSGDMRSRGHRLGTYSAPAPLRPP